MGNNNLDNTQTQETQSQEAEVQNQEVQTEQKGADTQSSTEPTYADLMKQIAELKVDNRRYKKANDSLASENAGLKKQVNAKLTEEELRAQQKTEEQDELKKEVAELRKEVALTKATKRYMSMNMPGSSLMFPVI